MARTDGSVFYMNDAAKQLVGLVMADITTLTIADFFPPEQVETITQQVRPARWRRMASSTSASSCRGPAVTLRPELTVAFALALHELATNAAKYGALSNAMGTVTLAWSIDGVGDDATLAISWREDGGPPVARPERKGFGSVLIERSLRSYFSGKAATDYRPEGLVFELEARLKDAAIVDGN